MAGRVLLLLLLATVAVQVYAKLAQELVVELSNSGTFVAGRYRVSLSGRGIRAFQGIPYAEAPVDSLRFAEAQPKAPWSGILDGSKNADVVCPQNDTISGRMDYQGQEDCLFLNVYTPLEPRSKGLLPVMFFIHGGGYMMGTGSGLLYGPDFLLDKDVILVAGNYRLGPLGFLNPNATEFGGNLGLKDQTLMLKWVQQNIKQFGGDPDAVTLFGQSAGAGSVGFHMMSAQSKGLFQQAIMQSGTPFDIFSYMGPKRAQRNAHKLFRSCGCESAANDYAQVVDCMRKVDAKTIIEKLTDFNEWSMDPMITFAPTLESVDGESTFLTERDLEEGHFYGHDIPIMLGLTSGEGAFKAIIDQPELVTDVEQRLDEVLPLMMFFGHMDNATKTDWMRQIREFYFEGRQVLDWSKDQQTFARVLSDGYFAMGFKAALDLRISASTKDTYVYKFMYRGKTSFTDLSGIQKEEEIVDLGVSHIDDLLYLFPIVPNLFNLRIMSKDDLRMVTEMVQLWTDFAITGHPSRPDLEWKPATKFPIEYLRIGNCSTLACDPTDKLASEVEEGFMVEPLEFWQALGKTYSRDETD